MSIEIHLGIGSNMGDRIDFLKKSVTALSEKLTEVRVSQVYESAAWGYEDQDDFLNAALVGHTSLSPQELLSLAKNIEAKLGREPSFRNGPRVIDIDILLYGDLEINEGPIEIPHASLLLRTFVLQPLVDLSPDLIPPGKTKSVANVLAEFDPKDLHPHYEHQLNDS
jgi:2-amino-4-hydroxy-6-hydroxymethyldihydropteridine diphosphokinase